MNMPKYNSANWDRDKKKYIDKDGDEIVSSCRFLLVAHTAIGFDRWVVVNSSVEKIT